MRCVTSKVSWVIVDNHWRRERSNDKGVIYAEMDCSFSCANYHHINGIVVFRIKWAENGIQGLPRTERIVPVLI